MYFLCSILCFMEYEVIRWREEIDDVIESRSDDVIESRSIDKIVI